MRKPTRVCHAKMIDCLQATFFKQIFPEHLLSHANLCWFSQYAHQIVVIIILVDGGEGLGETLRIRITTASWLLCPLQSLQHNHHQHHHHHNTWHITVDRLFSLRQSQYKKSLLGMDLPVAGSLLLFIIIGMVVVVCESYLLHLNTHTHREHRHTSFTHSVCRPMYAWNVSFTVTRKPNPTN